MKTLNNFDIFKFSNFKIFLVMGKTGQKISNLTLVPLMELLMLQFLAGFGRRIRQGTLVMPIKVQDLMVSP